MNLNPKLGSSIRKKITVQKIVLRKEASLKKRRRCTTKYGSENNHCPKNSPYSRHCNMSKNMIQKKIIMMQKIVPRKEPLFKRWLEKYIIPYKMVQRKKYTGAKDVGLRSKLLLNKRCGCEDP